MNNQSQLEAESTPEVHFTVPPTVEDFMHSIVEEHQDELRPTDERVLQDVKLHWRGMPPTEAVGLVTGAIPEIELPGKSPNTTINWMRAISYGTRGVDAEKFHYTIALGFLPEDDWTIVPAQSKVSEDLQRYETVMSYQRGNFIVSGKLHSDDVRYVVLREAGSEPGKPGPVHVFEYHKAGSAEPIQ